MNGSSLRSKFKINFVKPLYKRMKHKKVKPKYVTTLDTKSTFNLGGTGIHVIKKILSDSNKGDVIVIKRNEVITNKHFLPSVSETNLSSSHIKTFNGYTRSLMGDDEERHKRVMSDNENINYIGAIKCIGEKSSKLTQAERDEFKVPGKWLRIYPLPKLPDEALFSVCLRSVFSQLGLASVLMLWTFIWVFTIHSFEGPYERQVSLQFEQEQNQLVIDLATELRQITSVSPKWKAAIVKRIAEERRLTMMAIERGAKINPGVFWDLSGTFLFTVYVMTALGFGAPVPQTLWGRTSALIYAVLAVPIHIYLMLNVSACVIVHTEVKLKRCRKKIRGDSSVANKLNNTKDNNGSRNSEILKSLNTFHFCKNIRSTFSLLCACQCLPFAVISYYICGVVAFGVLREKPPLESALFPLEFTTTGGLEQIEGYVRILYGFYVEGAMMLLAFTLENLRRHSSNVIESLAKKYRLFQEENV